MTAALRITNPAALHWWKECGGNPVERGGEKPNHCEFDARTHVDGPPVSEERRRDVLTRVTWLLDAGHWTDAARVVASSRGQAVCDVVDIVGPCVAVLKVEQIVRRIETHLMAGRVEMAVRCIVRMASDPDINEHGER